MRIAATVILCLGLIPGVAQAQNVRPDPGALSTALKHLRGDLPDQGVIALQTSGPMDTLLASQLAARIDAQSMPEDSIFICVVTKDPGRRCSMTVAGAFIIDSLESINPDQLQVVLWTSREYSVDGADVIHFRRYRVDVQRAADGSWRVAESRLLGVS